LQSELIKSYLFTLSNQETIDVAGPIYVPLSNDSQSPSSSAPLSPLLPPDGHPNRHPDKYSNSDMDYLNNKLNSDAIEAL
jgi:hypothetical protein